jgi:type I restriction enzyme, S subunit
LEQQIVDATSQLADLDRAILSKAFRGELVPQDPNAEPASELLERIRTERAALLKEGKDGSRSRAKKTRRVSRGGL